MYIRSGRLSEPFLRNAHSCAASAGTVQRTENPTVAADSVQHHLHFGGSGCHHRAYRRAGNAGTPNIRKFHESYLL